MTHHDRPSLALLNPSNQVEQLDGRRLTLPLGDSVVTPGSERRLAGEGMPVSKSPGQKGDLVVKFDVTFPAALSEAQKQKVRAVLQDK